MSGAAPIKLTKQIWINPLENQKLNTTVMYIQYGNKRGSHFRPQKVTSVDCITAEIRFSLGNPRSFVRQLSLCNGTMEAQPGGVSPGWVFAVSTWSTGRFMFWGAVMFRRKNSELTFSGVGRVNVHPHLFGKILGLCVNFELRVAVHHLR